MNLNKLLKVLGAIALVAFIIWVANWLALDIAYNWGGK